MESDVKYLLIILLFRNYSLNLQLSFKYPTCWMRFNGSHIHKRAIDIILPQKRGKFLFSKGNGNMLTFGIIVLYKVGIIYLNTWAIALLLAYR